MQGHRLQVQNGFSLVELMLVVALLSILIVTAIPVILEYRKKMFDSRTIQDVSSLATSQEEYFIANEQYFSCIGSVCEEQSKGFKLSPGVIIAATGDENTFTIIGSHPGGSRSFTWSSTNGGLQP